MYINDYRYKYNIGTIKRLLIYGGFFNDLFLTVTKQ